jgi:hypothetical protein
MERDANVVPGRSGDSRSFTDDDGDLVSFAGDPTPIARQRHACASHRNPQRRPALALAELNGDAEAMLLAVCIECAEDLDVARARCQAQASGCRLIRVVEKRWGMAGRAEMWDIPRERLHTASEHAGAINRGYDVARVDVEGNNARVLVIDRSRYRPDDRHALSQALS